MSFVPQMPRLFPLNAASYAFYQGSLHSINKIPSPSARSSCFDFRSIHSQMSAQGYIFVSCLYFTTCMFLEDSFRSKDFSRVIFFFFAQAENECWITWVSTKTSFCFFVFFCVRPEKLWFGSLLLRFHFFHRP